jgi:hypothetical protein
VLVRRIETNRFENTYETEVSFVTGGFDTLFATQPPKFLVKQKSHRKFSVAAGSRRLLCACKQIDAAVID